METNISNESNIGALIISDVHLGSDLNRVRDLLNVLKTASFDRLIILGDLFDHCKLYKLHRVDWEFIYFIKRLSAEKEIIWVEGNHDEQLFNVIPSLLGIRAEKQFEWSDSGTKFLAIHGHQFDHYHLRKSLLPKLGGNVQRFFLRLEKRIGTDYLNRLAHKNKSWIRLAEAVGLRAIEYARHSQANFVFCGHTHRADRFQVNDITYVNTGCWHDRICHFVTVKNAEVSLNSYSS